MEQSRSRGVVAPDGVRAFGSLLAGGAVVGGAVGAAGGAGLGDQAEEEAEESAPGMDTELPR